LNAAEPLIVEDDEAIMGILASVQSNSSNSSNISLVHRWGRSSSSGEERFPEGSFIRLASQLLTTRKPETEKFQISGDTGLISPAPTRKVRVSSS